MLKERNVLQCELIREYFWKEHPTCEEVISWVELYARLVWELLNKNHTKEEIKTLIY